MGDRAMAEIKTRDGSLYFYTHNTGYGPVPAGLHVLHRCDTPSCVNPNHLFVGTNLDNIADKIAKGRQYRPTPATHCKNGHAFAMHGAIRKGSNGRFRYCKACKLAAGREYEARHAARRKRSKAS